jgi:hypothetical protein
MPGSDERPSEDKRPGFGRVLLLLDVLLRAGVALLTSPFHGLVLCYRDRRFVRRMREQGRFIPWPQLEPHLVKGPNTSASGFGGHQAMSSRQCRTRHHQRKTSWTTSGAANRIPS